MINKFTTKPCRVFYCKEENPDIYGDSHYLAQTHEVRLRGRVKTTGMFVCSRVLGGFPMVVSSIEELPDVDYGKELRDAVGNAIADVILGSNN